MELKNIPIGKIKPDENQPRKYFDDETMERLVQSIKDNGIEQPIIVKISGDSFIIIDGERRYRASNKCGLKEIPCIVTKNDDVLEMQLRSDCLKDGLTVDELDRAIYRYYMLMQQTSLSHPSKVNKGENPYCQMIADAIGKSAVRVRKAIDRFEFKRDNQEFVKQIEDKHLKKDSQGNKQDKFGKVNSTIAMTDKLKDKPESRQAVIKAILNDGKKQNKILNNEKIKEKINHIIKNKIENPEDIQTVFENEKNSDFKKDPRTVLIDFYFDFSALTEKFFNEKYKWKEASHMIQGEKLKSFIEESKKFYEFLKSLEGK